MAGFDWQAMTELGLRHLRLTPDRFWALTPAELRMMAGPPAKAALGRDGFDALMARFPDLEE
ncbi:MAG: rcc01693 family protein [Shimia sp.]